MALKVVGAGPELRLIFALPMCAPIPLPRCGESMDGLPMPIQIILRGETAAPQLAGIQLVMSLEMLSTLDG